MRCNKYNVAPVSERTCDGIVFDSKKEMLAYVNQFRPLMRAGIQVDLQQPFPLYASCDVENQQPPLTYALLGKYIADFVVTEKDGTVRVYDVKGVRTELYKLKKKIFESNYPHLRIVEL